MTTRLLLGSGGFRTEERKALYAQEMRLHFGPVERVLFVPYAVADHDRYVALLTEAGFHAGYEIDGIHRHADPVAAVRAARAIYVGGGNTFRLVRDMQRHGLMDAVREQVRSGVPYMGVSAGSNVACPTMKTTNDMPIVRPASFATLDLVPFQINAHYYVGMIHVRRGDEFVEHFGETRDDRIREFHEENDAPVVGLWEGGLLRVRDGEVELVGAPARVFRKGREAVDVEPGEHIGALLA